MGDPDLYETLDESLREGSTAAVITSETRARPEPAGSRINPPTYPSDGGKPPQYAREQRHIDGQSGRPVVLLDSYQSQANRGEAALLRAYRAGLLNGPQFVVCMDIEGRGEVRLSSLEMPSRFADAYLRDSRIGEQRFDDTDYGKSFQLATPDNAQALYRRSPESLVFGAWNSFRKGWQAKFPRVYASEMIGLDPEDGHRFAGRSDPLNLQGLAEPTDGGDWRYLEPTEQKDDKDMERRLSKRGLGSIRANPAPGGVTITEARRLGTLSLTGLRRIGFGDGTAEALPKVREAAHQARIALAALALTADRLAFGGASIYLRSGCDLVVLSDEVAVVHRGGRRTTLTITAAQAIAAFNKAVGLAAKDDLPMDTDVVTLTPDEAKLAPALRYAFLRAASIDESPEHAA